MSKMSCQAPGRRVFFQALSQSGSAGQSARIRDAGFADVTLDTKGYRRGSLNEGIPEENLANG